MHKDTLKQLTDLADKLGAEGIWIIRGATVAGLAFSFDEPNEDRDPALQMLHIAEPHEMIVLLRFEQTDGGAGGVENW